MLKLVLLRVCTIMARLTRDDAIRGIKSSRRILEANRGWMFYAGCHRQTVNVGLWRQSLSRSGPRLVELAPVVDVGI
jgi:hypothetical protein